MKELQEPYVGECLLLGAWFQIFTSMAILLIMCILYDATKKIVPLESIKSYTWVYIIGAVFVTPVIEEFMFRGFLYGLLKKKLSIKTSMYLSSIVFGLLHINLVQAVFATLFGIMACKIYELRQSIWYPIIIHGASNLAAILLHYFIKKDIIKSITIDSDVSLILLLVILLLAVFNVWMVFNNIKKKNEETESYDYLDLDVW